MQWTYQRTVLLIMLLANFGQFLARLVIGPLVPDIIATYEVTRGSVGLALTGMWGVYAFMQFPSGVLADRFGERIVIIVSLALTIAGSTLLAVSPSFLTFSVFIMLLGIGSGFFFTVAASLIARLFEQTGRALGSLTSGAMVSGLIGPVIAAWLAARYGWRWGILLGAAVLVPVVVLAAWRIRPTPPERPSLAITQALFRPKEGILSSLCRREIAFTTIIAGVATFVFQAFTSFFPTFLIDYHGFSTQSASVAFGAIFLVAAVGTPSMGILSDHVGRDIVLACVLFAIALGFGTLLLGPFAAVVAGIGFVAIGMTWFGVVNARYMDRLSEERRGTGFGVVRTIYMFFGALGSVVTGVLADVAGWPAAFGLLVVLTAGVALTLLANRIFELGL